MDTDRYPPIRLPSGFRVSFVSTHDCIYSNERRLRVIVVIGVVLVGVGVPVGSGGRVGLRERRRCFGNNGIYTTGALCEVIHRTFVNADTR